MAGRTMALLCAALSLLVVSCAAPAPTSVDGPRLPLADGGAGYVAHASCTPQRPCPGADCADMVEGKPDGQHLDLSRCPLLDLFTGREHALGVTLHLAAPITDKLVGGLMVEVSSLGTGYLPGGSLNWLSDNNNDPCSPRVSGQRVEFERWCWITNPAYEVRYLRLITKDIKAGTLLLDAVELTTERP